MKGVNGQVMQCRQDNTDVYESEVRYECLYLADDFGLGWGIERFQRDIEYRLLLGLLLKRDERTRASMACMASPQQPLPLRVQQPLAQMQPRAWQSPGYLAVSVGGNQTRSESASGQETECSP